MKPYLVHSPDPSDPICTGKIMALDSIYHYDNADGTTID
jgi:hypothetical protein